MLSNQERLILLNLIPEIGSTRLRRLLDVFGDLTRLWAATPQDLQQVEGIGPQLAQHVAAGCRNDRRLTAELARAKREGVAIVTLEDAEYPKLLRTIPDPPLALYLKGSLQAEDEVAVAVVGSRRASVYGIQCAERLGYDLSLRGVRVISGLARGIDAASHRGALRAGGRTLAVLGSGLARVYPPEHEGLAAQVAGQGALISEYPMETPPLPHNFPRRNRIISGLSLGVVIVEAARRSGALITADCALEQGREVFAVPGPVTAPTSQGTHQLVKQGARLVTSVDDILEELRLPAPRQHLPAACLSPSGDGRQAPAAQAGTGQAGLTAQAAPQRVAPDQASETMALPELEQRVFACVGEGQPTYIDAIAAQSGLAVADVSSLLMQLELKRVVQQLPGKQFVKRTMAAAFAA